MRNLIALLLIIGLPGTQFTFGQGVNNISIQPVNPTSNDTVLVISDFSYYGNCYYGLVNAQINQSGSIITIYPEYCGFGDTTLCNSIDTISLGILPLGNYTINIEYHQGSVCPISGFDSIIDYADTNLVIGILSNGSITPLDHGIEIYPNPTANFINIQSKSAVKAIELLDLTGKKIKQSLNDESLDIRSLSQGFYLLKIQLNNGKTVIKEIIINNAH